MASSSSSAAPSPDDGSDGSGITGPLPSTASPPVARSSDSNRTTRNNSRTTRSHSECERALRRALSENERVREINSALLSKLSHMTRESEAGREGVRKMKVACDSMKRLAEELVEAANENKKGNDGEGDDDEASGSGKDGRSNKDGDGGDPDERDDDGDRNGEAEVSNIYKEGANDAEESCRARLEALEIGQRAADRLVVELRTSLEAARSERDEAMAEKECLMRTLYEVLKPKEAPLLAEREEEGLESGVEEEFSEEEFPLPYGWEDRFCASSSAGELLSCEDRAEPSEARAKGDELRD